MRAIGLWMMGVACSGEYGLQPERVPPADPPGEETDALGGAPDWQNCFEGWRGLYYNLTSFDAWVAPRPVDEPAPTSPDGFDYWESSVFEKYEPTLDFGQNWWPVDEELEDDPQYFAAYWHAWLRAWSDTDIEISFASQDDGWVYLNGEPLIENPGIHEFERRTYTTRVDGGQYPIEVWFAHRGSDNSGFSFRVVSGDVSLCYPDFETTTAAR